MARLKQLVHEIHRRSMWQVLGTYVAAAWIALQTVEVLMGTIGLPAWVPRSTLLLFGLGLPIILVTSFVQHGIGRRATRKASEAERNAAAETEEAHGEPERPTGPGEEQETAVGSMLAAGAGAIPHRIFTWRNVLVAGVLAFAILGVATAGYMAMRSLGIGPAGTLVAKGVLEERAPVLLADFGSATGDTVLARVATEAFRVDLSGSEVVKLAEPSFVSEALRRMQRGADAPLDAMLARELAVREGIAAVISGEVNSAGTAFVLSTQIQAAESGETLARDRRTASDSSDIIDAIDKLSKKLRERMGESLKSLSSAEPLARVTTGSLPALRFYSQAVHAIELEGNADRGISLLEQAVALDTAFAMAYRKLGIALSNQNRQRGRQIDALTKAYEHRERLSERERYLTTASYYMTVHRDMQRSIAAYETLLEVDPSNHAALNNLGVIYTQQGNHALAEAQFRRAIGADSADLLSYGNAAGEQIAQGKLDEAERTLGALRARSAIYPATHIISAGLEAWRGDYESASGHFRALEDQWPGNPLQRAIARTGLAGVAATQGKLAEAETYYRDVLAAQEQLGMIDQYLGTAGNLAAIDFVIRRDTAAAVARIDAALEAHPLSEIESLDRPYLGLAYGYAAMGEPERAREMGAEFERVSPPESRTLFDEIQGRMLLGAIAMAEGSYDDAIEKYRRSETPACEICQLTALGQAYEAAGQRDSAIAVYERYTETPVAYRLQLDQYFLAGTYERLGQLYDEADDLEKAAEYYARFVKLWAGADSELQPRVQAAQARLQQIVNSRG